MLATFAASKIHNFKHPGTIGIHSATLATSGGFGNSAKNSGVHHPTTLATSGFGNSAKNSGIHPATATSGFVRSLCQRTLEFTQQQQQVSGFGSNSLCHELCHLNHFMGGIITQPKCNQ